MEFKLTEDTLQRLEQKEEVTVRDIMGFVVDDICRDIQSNGGELTRLKLGNDDQEENDAILFICNLARKLAKIQSRNQEKFDAPDYRPVWNGANKKLKEAMEQLTAIEEEINKKQQIIAELEGTLQKIGDNQAKIAEYEKLTEEKENAIRLAESIEEKCQELRKETAQIRETKIPAVMQQQKVVEADLKAAEQELKNEKQKQQHHIAEIEQELENKKQKYQQCIAEQEQELENKKQKHQQYIAEQEENLKNKEQKHQQYIAEQEQNLRNKKQEMQHHIVEMDQKLENKRQELQPHFTELNQKNQKLQELGEQLEDLRKKKQTLAETTESMQNQKAETEREIRQTEAQIGEIQQKISEEKQLLAAKKEDYSWQREEQKHVDKELEKLEESFGESLLTVRRSQESLKEIYESFTKEQILESGWFFDQNKIKELQRYFQDSLVQTEENINQSREIYNKLLKYLENGGN